MVPRFCFSRAPYVKPGPQRCAEAGAFVTITHPAWYALTLTDAETIASAHAMLLGRGSRAEQVLAPTGERIRLPTAKFKGDYVRTVVVDGQGRRAWSNPIWLPA